MRRVGVVGGGDAVTLNELPLVDHNTPGYDRIWTIPLHWPVWEEGDGECYALTFESTPLVMQERDLCKERIPREVFEQLKAGRGEQP